MLLAIDIGNTNINCGLFKGQRLLHRFFYPTRLVPDSIKNHKFILKKNLSKVDLRSISCVIVCSVVPSKTSILKEAISHLVNAKILVLGKDIIVPIKNLYKDPQKVGQDRLVNAYAGLKLFGPALILIDFGTAITFDIVSKKGQYLGGMIFPGLGISLKALSENTALLPLLKKDFPKVLIGTDTQESLLSGVIFGTAEMTDGLIERIQRRYRGFKVIATGGDAGYISRFCKKIDVVDPVLTLKGIMLVFSWSNKSTKI